MLIFKFTHERNPTLKPKHQHADTLGYIDLCTLWIG